MNDVLSSLLLVVGGFIMLLAGVGVLRMPDLYSRLQATTKAATLGIGCLLMSVALHFDSLGVTTRALLIAAFVFLTSPIAAHVIGHAAYSIGVPFWERSVVDELQELKSTDPLAAKRVQGKMADPFEGPSYQP